jgi:putative endonuclease
MPADFRRASSIKILLVMIVEKTFFVYFVASKRNGTIYTSVTSDLEKRIWEHKNDVLEGFTKRYKVHSLVYYEDGGDALNAIRREKQLKKWNRAWENGILPLPRE